MELYRLFGGLFLVGTGAMAITNLQMEGAPVVLGFLALLAGICWLLGR